MAKFNFELDSVLKFKKQSESNKINQLSKEVTLLNNKINDLDTIITSMENARGSFNKNMNNCVSILDIQSHYSYMSNLNYAKKTKERDIDDQTSIVENTRKELLDIAREKKTLEILEEQKYEDFKKGLLKMEQVENDERNSYNHSKSNSINHGSKI